MPQSEAHLAARNPSAARFRVRRAIFTSGERFPCIIDGKGFPLSLPTRYYANEVQGKLRPNSIENGARAIMVLYRWADQLDAPWDPEQRLRSGPLLSNVEIASFASFARAGGAENVTAFPVYSGEGLGADGVKSDADYNNALRVVRDFAGWAANSQQTPRATSEEVRELKARFDAQLLPDRKAPAKYGLDDAAIARVMTAVDPESPGNPFNRPVRQRNAAIIRVLNDTGIRRAELCCLRVRDVVGYGDVGPFIDVVDRPHDRVDPRRNQPLVKTENRRIPITKALHRELVACIARRGRQRHPFLFVNSNVGTPLNVGAINKIVARVGRSLGMDDLTPHIFRHSFASRMWTQTRALKYKEQHCEDVVNFLCGWSVNSKQSRVYTRSAVEASAMVAVEALHKATDLAASSEKVDLH